MEIYENESKRIPEELSRMIDIRNPQEVNVRRLTNNTLYIDVDGITVLRIQGNYKIHFEIENLLYREENLL